MLLYTNAGAYDSVQEVQRRRTRKISKAFLEGYFIITVTDAYVSVAGDFGIENTTLRLIAVFSPDYTIFQCFGNRLD